MNIIQDRINKGILKFLVKNEVIVIDEDPFLTMAPVNIAATDLRAVLNVKKNERFSIDVRVRKVWIPKQYLVHKDELAKMKSVYNQRKGKEWKAFIPFKRRNQE